MGTIHQVMGQRGQFTGEKYFIQNFLLFITNTKLSAKKLLNLSWYLTVSLITSTLCNNPTLSNCFHFCI